MVDGMNPRCRGLCGVSGSWWCALGFSGFKKQVYFDHVVVAVESCSWDGVNVVDNISPVLVNDGVIKLHHVAVGSFVCMSVLWCFLHPGLRDAEVL